ncbi:MAG TPA: transporter [Candidatus Limnocylindrales bacterium]|jgi:hypothetical protein|nr:transporter [Candidatus Limnocylindrales bacterium]
MKSQSKALFILLALMLASTLAIAQQKGQYVTGQFGLDSGLLPEPGLTYTNMSLHYNSDTLRNANGSNTPINGNLGFWINENIVTYVAPFKIAGAKLALTAVLPAANGSASLERFAAITGGNNIPTGYADTWVQPVTLGWQADRIAFNVGYAFMAPTGRYTPGATDNVGSGYWGNNLNSGTTVYLTKNKGTSLSLFTNWEGHGVKSGTNKTPGQAFTDEWGLGQMLPLAKDESKLIQLGVIGYDQWEITDDKGTIGPGIPAGITPHYQVHALGFQTNFIMPKKGFVAFFKFEPEYLAKARPEGQTIVFGASYTFKFPGK